MLTLLVLLCVNEIQSAGILYPRHNEVREVLSLDGFWNFVLGNGTKEEYHRVDIRDLGLDVELMPIPASFNEITTKITVRDHVGVVWYQRSFFVPKTWQSQRVWLRFASVSRGAEVWFNGLWAVSHEIGHLPFQIEVTSMVKFGAENNVTVAVNNTLLSTTIPQGTLQKLSSGRIKQTYTFEFYNYAGIDRPVVLYTTPKTYIDDITVSYDIDGANGFIDYSVAVEGSDAVTAKVTLLDKTDAVVVSDTILKGLLFVRNAHFWWPYLMDPEPGYMYTFQVELMDTSGKLADKYSLPVGIRTLSWDNATFKINNKKAYLRGFGRHEDSEVRGKGLDLAVVVKDYNLLKWIGANSYRTSHYPYAEEIMDMADQVGIMIIDESPAVNTENYTDILLTNHKQSMTELIQRDKNRPAVVMWSAANEPKTQFVESGDYYKEVVRHIKSLDRSRPVTVANFYQPDVEYSGKYLDIASFNLYVGWYANSGDQDVITETVVAEARRWHELYNIPVMQTEYGTGTYEGLHLLPAFTWSEEFQTSFISKYFRAFDQLREEGFFVGEMIWNFADYKTPQTYNRMGMDKKGVFTRVRQPKASAHLLRRRYWALAKYLDEAEVPEDLDGYIFASNRTRDEL